MTTLRLTSIAALLAALALQGCSDKTVTAPAPAPVAAPVPAAASAAPVAHAASTRKRKALPRAATMDCGERKVVLEASCLDLVGPEMLACTSQSLVFSDSASGKVLATRTFAAAKAQGDEPATIEEKIGEMSCVATARGVKYVVTNMFNGGNCEACEWNEVYSWDGALLGSDRDKKLKIAAVEEALAAINEKDVDRVTGMNDVAGFYSEPAKK